MDGILKRLAALSVSPRSFPPSPFPCLFLPLMKTVVYQGEILCIYLKATGFFFFNPRYCTSSKHNQRSTSWKYESVFSMIRGKQDTSNVKMFTICPPNIVLLSGSKMGWGSGRFHSFLILYIYIYNFNFKEKSGSKIYLLLSQTGTFL